MFHCDMPTLPHANIGYLELDNILEQFLVPTSWCIRYRERLKVRRLGQNFVQLFRQYRSYQTKLHTHFLSYSPKVVAWLQFDPKGPIWTAEPQ